MPELYVEARAENDAEQLQNRQAQANRPKDDQVILRRLQKLVDTTLNKRIISYDSTRHFYFLSCTATS